jgi:hypothetical protein
MRSARILGLVCVFLLCGLLVAGLWPFHAPRNEVTWLERSNGLRFGGHGTISSSGTFNTIFQNEARVSLEIWSQPSRTTASNIFLTFYTSENPLQFSLRQYRADLVLRTEFRDEQRHASIRTADIEGVFSSDKPSFVTITASPRGTAVYLDGVLLRTFPGFWLSGRDLAGQLVFGGSPVECDTWAGQLRGLAIYRQELTGAQVLQHYKSWTTERRPSITADQRSVALYVFEERRGNVVHDQVGSGIDLHIPEQFTLVDPTFLGSPSLRDWHDILVNIAGFIPVGFFFRAYFSTRQIKRPAAAAMAVGGVLSLTVEILQVFLPTRDSDMTDLITNVLGTSVGVVLYRCKGVRAFLVKI